MWTREVQPLGLWSPARAGYQIAVARAVGAPTLRWTAAPWLSRSGSTRQRVLRLEHGNGRERVVVAGAGLSGTGLHPARRDGDRVRDRGQAWGPVMDACRQLGVA